jgi:hypothetical protein
MDIVKEAIVYPFKEKDWTKKYLVVVVILLASIILSTIVSFLISFPLQMLSAFSGIFSGNSTDSVNLIGSMASMFSSFASMFVSIITIPVTFYLLGYFLEVVKAILHKNKDIIPFHKDIFQKITSGALLYIIQLITSLPGVIVGITLTLIGGVGIYFLTQITSNSPIFIVLLVLLIVVLFLLYIVIAFLSILIGLSSTYIFVLTGDFGKALNVKRIFELIKKYWREFLSIYGYTILFGLLTIPACFVSMFTAFLGFPVVMASYYFAIAYTTGTYFKKIKEEEKE